jgi:hypothetical protein
VPVLDPQTLDQLGGGAPRLREFLAHPLAERRSERVHLPHRGLARFSTVPIEAEDGARVCAESVTLLAWGV